jgi:hypothetical protein
MALLSFRQFLVEKIIPVQKTDIDLMYQPLDHIVKQAQQVFSIKDLGEKREAVLNFASLLHKNQKWLDIFPSSKLQSKAAKLANEINPVRIEIWTHIPNNNYNPQKKVIQIGISENAVLGLFQYRYFSTSVRAQLETEFSKEKIKSTIRHELTHWLDDSLNNLHMSKIAQIGDPEKFIKFLKSGQQDISLGHIEVNAVVSQIAEIKRMLGRKKYERLSWDELMSLHPSLKMLNTKMGAPWRRKIASRMSREGLLDSNKRF